jgi:hypothetical protein
MGKGYQGVIACAWALAAAVVVPLACPALASSAGGFDHFAPFCPFLDSNPLVFINQPNEAIFSFEMFNSSDFTDEVGASLDWVSPELKTLNDWVATFTTSDPFALLRRQREFFRGQASELAVYDKVLSGQTGRVRAISCLEARLLTEHLKRFPTWKKATEFQAIALTGNTQLGPTLRVYFASADLGGVTPTFGSLFETHIKRDIGDGWVPEFHLHNHPFNESRASNIDVAGTPIPSAGDANSYIWLRNQLGLREARITNGFSTIELPARDFEALQRTDGTRH